MAVDERDIHEVLTVIWNDAQEKDAISSSKEALGAFTSLPRTEWAAARNELCKVESNARALQVVDSALFVLVLDSIIPENIHEAAANMLHGVNKLAEDDTLQIGSCLNRWYDKLQLIVCRDGSCGVNFEHSSIDGHTALRFASDVFAETVISFAESIVDLIHGHGRISHVVVAKVRRAIDKKNTGTLLDVYPKKLTFELSKGLKQRISYAETALCDELSANDSRVLEFRDYGKLFIVRNKCSPDSYVQMSILLAYYRLYGKVVSMYEPVLTKSFYHGRTEGMRTATVQAKRFCEVWCDPDSPNALKIETLRAATVEHSRLVKECALGNGVDRHLYSLKCLANRQGLDTPAFFKSHAWQTLNHTILSTSNCGNPALRLFGFGPVVPNGFGVGYIIKDHGLSYSVSSKHRQTQRFVGSLQCTLKMMETAFQTTSVPRVRSRLTLFEAKEDEAKTFVLDTDDEYDVWGENNSPPTQNFFPAPPTHSRTFSKVVELADSISVLKMSGDELPMANPKGEQSLL